MGDARPAVTFEQTLDSLGSQTQSTVLPIGTDRSPKVLAPEPAVPYFRPHGKYP